MILGRAAAVVLAQHKSALHVRLGGHRAARIERIMTYENLDRPAAEKLVDRTDRTWESYCRYFYKTDPRDPKLYHLTIDAVSLGSDTVTELIVTAAKARTAAKLA